MFIIESYSLAVILCFVTMVCWGSWANTQKLVAKDWPFPLFYWDYSIGVLLMALLMGVTLGSFGETGRGFFSDLQQGSFHSIAFAFLGGVIFNLANLLIVAAIAIAGMAVAFPLGIGIALVIGVVVNYLADPVGDPLLLFSGVGLVVLAILFDALAYRSLSVSETKTPTRGIILSVLGGILMGFFYRFVATSVSLDFAAPEPGKLTTYSAVFIFAIGIFLSNFIWNSWFMRRPFKGEPVSYGDYFHRGNSSLHLVGILGGVIWCTGMSFNFIASEQAGFAISYGLGQGATMVAAIWGVFIWKEFKQAPANSQRLINWMFVSFAVGLALIVFARL